MIFSIIKLCQNKIDMNVTQLIKFDNISSKIMHVINYIHKIQEEFINRLNDKEYCELKQKNNVKDNDYGILSHLSRHKKLSFK